MTKSHKDVSCTTENSSMQSSRTGPAIVTEPEVYVGRITALNSTVTVNVYPDTNNTSYASITATGRTKMSPSVSEVTNVKVTSAIVTNTNGAHTKLSSNANKISHGLPEDVPFEFPITSNLYVNTADYTYNDKRTTKPSFSDNGIISDMAMEKITTVNTSHTENGRTNLTSRMITESTTSFINNETFHDYTKVIENNSMIVESITKKERNVTLSTLSSVTSDEYNLSLSTGMFNSIHEKGFEISKINIRVSSLTTLNPLTTTTTTNTHSWHATFFGQFTISGGKTYNEFATSSNSHDIRLMKIQIRQCVSESFCLHYLNNICGLLIEFLNCFTIF